MYTLWIRNTNDSNFEDMCIYNDESTLEEFKIESGSLSLEEGSAGSLSIKLPITNDSYDYYELFATEITIKKKGVVYWMGRLLSSSEDFYENLSLKFEGTYNYLMDTIVTQYHYVGRPSEWARFILDYHNKDHATAGEFWKVIQPGIISLNDTALNEDFYSDYETALDLINNVCEGWGGHLTFRYAQYSRVTYSDGTYTNYDEPYWNVIVDINYQYDASGNIPTITFGENLEDFTKENNVDELATVVIPRGKPYDDEETAEVVASFEQGQTQVEYQLPVEGLDYYRTIYRVNGGSIYLVTTNDEMLARFGMVCKVVDFTDCEDFNQLKSLGQTYLEDQKWIGTTITIKAIDATLLGVTDVSEIKIGKAVKCYSEPHGLNHIYPCTAIEENLLDPSATTFTLGIKDDKYMSDSSRKADEDLRKLIVESRKKEAIIKQNTEYAIEGSYNDSSIWSSSQLMSYVQGKIDAGVSTAESVATGDAKNFALQTLNVFDSTLNNNKGYVFFKKKRETTQNAISIPFLVERVTKYFTDSSVNNFFNYLRTAFTWDSHITIIALLGPHDYETAIYVSWSSYDVPGFSSNYGNYYSIDTHYSHVQCGGYFVSYDTTHYGTAYNMDQRNTAPITFSAMPTDFQTLYDYRNNFYYYYPNKATIDNNGNGYSVYINRDIHTSTSSSSDVYFTKNFYKTEEEVPTTSYEHIYEICISDIFDYMDPSANIWRWNKTGLYYIHGSMNDTELDVEHGEYGSNTDNLRVAITYDGSIVADRISVGKLDAGIIRAGYLASQDYLVENGGSGDINDAHFLLDINNGIMTAKTGTIIFNDDNNNLKGNLGSDKIGNDHFVYISNKTTGELAGTNASGTNLGYMYVSGERSRDWMMIIGSSFGVDRHGRAFMREGIIGATGGIWNLKFYNDSKVYVNWFEKDSSTAELKYHFEMNSTSYRPLGAQVAPSNIYNDSSQVNMMVCRWRMAKFTNGDLSYYSKIHNLVMPAGNDSVKYGSSDEWLSFYPAITYPGTPSEAGTAMSDTYWAGVFFPVFYQLSESAEDPDYTEDGHSYILYDRNSTTGLKGGTKKITGGSTDKPEYTCTGGGGYTSVGSSYSDTGAVRIGTGYIYQGTIGTNSSFSLSGINRTATLSVPNGSGGNTTTRDDWRLTVGSRFGVTDDGTLHCAGAYLRNAIVDSTISASYVNTNNVGGVKINSSQDLDGSNINYYITIEADWTSSAYYSGPAWLQMYVTSGTTYDSNTQETDIIDPVTVSGHSYIPQTNFYDDIEFQIQVDAEFADENDVSRVTQFRVYTGTFTFDKTTQTYIDKYIVQEWSMGDAHAWATHSGWVFHWFVVRIEMVNEKIDATPTWQMTSWTQDTTQRTDHSFTGTMCVTKGIANQPRTVTDFGSRDIVGSSRWIGGPNKIWARSYINAMHYHEAISGLSSRVYKNSIISMPDIYDKLFDDLRPVTFFYNKAERHVRHTGFIMEEVGDAMSKNGISPIDFGAYSPHIGGAGGELCYLDFIALNTKQIQKLKQRIKELEERLDEVERNEDSSNT